MNRITKTIAAIAVGLGALLASSAMGSVALPQPAPAIGTYPHCLYGVAHGDGAPQCSMPEPQAPRACSHPSLPSGDAARLGGRTFVCTDGTWVRVTRYGS